MWNHKVNKFKFGAIRILTRMENFDVKKDLYSWSYFPPLQIRLSNLDKDLFNRATGVLVRSLISKLPDFLKLDTACFCRACHSVIEVLVPMAGSF